MAIWSPMRPRRSMLKDPSTAGLCLYARRRSAIYEDIWDALHRPPVRSDGARKSSSSPCSPNSAESKPCVRAVFRISRVSRPGHAIAVNLRALNPLRQGPGRAVRLINCKSTRKRQRHQRGWPTLAGKTTSRIHRPRRILAIRHRARWFPDLAACRIRTYEVTYSGSHDQSMWVVVAGRTTTRQPVRPKWWTAWRNAAFMTLPRCASSGKRIRSPRHLLRRCHDLTQAEGQDQGSVSFSYDFTATAWRRVFGREQIRSDLPTKTSGPSSPDPVCQWCRVHATRPCC